MSNLIEIIFRGKNQVGPVAEDVKESLGGVQEAAQKTGSAFDTAMGVLAAEQLQQFGNAVSGFMSSAIEEAGAAQSGMAQLEAVIKSTGGAAGITAKAANDLAGSLSEVTRFEDDAIIAGENMLLTFTNIGKDVFPQTTKTMLDMSQALGQDLTSSAMQLGKALNDPIKGVTALQRVGVTFTDSQKDMIKALVKSGDVAKAQGIILAELQKEFGGSAEAAGKTFAGSLDRLNNAWGNFGERIGEVITKNEGIQKMLDSLIKLIGSTGDAFAALPEPVQTAIVGVIGLVAVLAKLAPALISAKVLLGGFGTAATAAGASSVAAGTAAAAGTAKVAAATVYSSRLAMAAAGASGTGAATGFTASLGAAFPLAVGAAGLLIEGVLINEGTKWGQSLAKSFYESIGVTLPPELQKLQDLIIEKGPFSREAWAQGINVVKGTFAETLQAASVSSQQLVFITSTGLESMMNNLTTWAAQTIMTATTASQQLVTMFDLGWSVLLAGASQSATQLVGIVQQAAGNVIGELQSWPGRISAAATRIGTSLVQGLWEGIQGAWDWLTSNIDAALDNLLAWVNDSIGAHSPADKWMPTGENMAMGVGAGWTRGMSTIGPTMSAALQPASVMAGVGGGRGLTINGAQFSYYAALTGAERKRIHRDQEQTAESTLLRALK